MRKGRRHLQAVADELGLVLVNGRRHVKAYSADGALVLVFPHGSISESKRGALDIALRRARRR